MQGDISYCCIQPSAAFSDAFLHLQEQVYGDSTALRQRWEWEFLDHPRQSEIRIYCAERDGQLVGTTVRHPATLRVEGVSYPVFFTSHSMVMPAERGKGIIRNLYLQAAEESDAIQFSKGTAGGMYQILKIIGYRDIKPNTYQVCILNPAKWVLQKLLKKYTGSEIDKGRIDALQGVTGSCGEIPDDISEIYCDGVQKDAGYLTWRYCRIPHKKYHTFVRRIAGKPVSFFVLRYRETTVYLVDIMWDNTAADEPSTTIKLAMKEARRMGAIRMVAWGIHGALRKALSKNMFFESNETPNFSYFCRPGLDEGISWSDLNFVHGDGDLDYL